MKRSILIIVVLALALLMAACQPSVDQAQADYCESAGEFAVAVA